MTTYAPNWTPRYKASYRAAGLIHSMTLRVARGASVPTVTGLAGVAHDFVAAHADALADDFEWIEASYALTDSDVFVPTAVPAAVTGALAAGGYTPISRISPLVYTGRSASGRARVSLYGVSFGLPGSGALPADFQITAAENADVAAAIAVLQAGAIGNAGEVTTWHNKTTQKPNDRLVKKLRQGAI